MAEAVASEQVCNADTVFARGVEDTPFLDWQNDPRFAAVQKSEALIKWLGGDDLETGPWVFWVDHPAGRKAPPHRHAHARIEYVLEGELHFYQDEEALKWHRGEPAEYAVYPAGTVSYVPAGQFYGYETAQPTKLLHVFFGNPMLPDRKAAKAQGEAAGQGD